MPDELGRFRTAGLSWSERAALGGLRAVIGPSSSSRNNNFLHGIHSYGAARALRLLPRQAAVVDFGCGNGRFSRFFADNGCSVLGTEITPQMIDQAREECPPACTFELTDGIHIPVPAASLDAIWCCGVLRFSLFGEDPVHDQIAAEMFRALRPGGRVVNLEVFVDQEPRVFTRDFESAGFVARPAHVVHRYGGRLEHYCKDKRIPEGLVPILGRVCASIRYHFDFPERLSTGLRDYFFVFDKPA